MRRQMRTRVNTKIQRHMQENRMIEGNYSDGSTNENPEDEGGATDAHEGAM